MIIKEIKDLTIKEIVIASVNQTGTKYQLITGARRRYYAEKHRIKEIPCTV
jgi:hypothetical protein